MAEMPVAEDDIKLDDEQASESARPKEQPVGQADQVEVLKPPEKVIRVLGRPKDTPADQQLGVEFAQQELSFFGKMELIRYLSGSLEKLLDAEGGITMWQFLEAIGWNLPEGAEVAMADSVRADIIIRGVARLTNVTPTLLEDLFCVVLQIQPEVREAARRMMRAAVADGGFDDDTGFDIIKVALRQNQDAFRRFFGLAQEMFADARKKVMATASENGQPSSTPSKDSPQTEASPSTSS